MRRKEAIVLYALLKKYKINVGKIIEESILDYYNTKYRGHLPHPTTITKLCSMQELAYYWEEEISCPKVSPLTLTGITRGPKNKRKEKPLVEEEREEAPRLEQNIEPTEEANEMLYLTKGTEPTCRRSTPILNMPSEEEVIMGEENRDEVPMVPLYDGAGEEIPRNKLPSWHLLTLATSFSPTWGRNQEARDIHSPHHASPGNDRNYPDQAEGSRQGQRDDDMMGMLQIMRKEMQQRDQHL